MDAEVGYTLTLTIRNVFHLVTIILMDILEYVIPLVHLLRMYTVTQLPVLVLPLLLVPLAYMLTHSLENV